MGRQRTYSGRKQNKYVYIFLKNVMNGHSDHFPFPSSSVIADVIKYGFNKKFLIPPLESQRIHVFGFDCEFLTGIPELFL